ncbi:MAG: hypothetical protein WBD40_20985, partial [Tepidisphaeraceae bacterium]
GVSGKEPRNEEQADHWNILRREVRTSIRLTIGAVCPKDEIRRQASRKGSLPARPANLISPARLPGKGIFEMKTAPGCDRLLGGSGVKRGGIKKQCDGASSACGFADDSVLIREAASGALSQLNRSFGHDPPARSSTASPASETRFARSSRYSRTIGKLGKLAAAARTLV